MSVRDQTPAEADTICADFRGGNDAAARPPRSPARTPKRPDVPGLRQPIVVPAKRAAEVPRPDKPSHAVPQPRSAFRAAGAVDQGGATGRSHEFLTPAKLEAFVAVAEEGRISAAARRLHVSQPTLSQTITALERQLGVRLLLRSNSGVQPTQAGITLLAEARALLARHLQMLRTLNRAATNPTRFIQLSIPTELAPFLLRAVARFAATHPGTRVIPHHLSMAEQLARLGQGNLDVSFMREHPAGAELDTMLVAEENLGVLLAGELGAQLAGPHGIALNALAGLEWISFPRSGSPAWNDELAATLRSHGIDTGDHQRGENFPIPSVTLTALSAGHAFAFGLPEWAHPIPDTIVWRPLVGNPVVQRTWAVWPAQCRSRDVADLIAGLEQTPTEAAWPPHRQHPETRQAPGCA
jgi:DNA-binding transcriptional LysR family regulator